MALVVFLQEDEDAPNVYRNLKIFCEMALWPFFECVEGFFGCVRFETLIWLVVYYQCDVPHQWIAQRQVGSVSVYMSAES